MPIGTGHRVAMAIAASFCRTLGTCFPVSRESQHWPRGCAAGGGSSTPVLPRISTWTPFLSMLPQRRPLSGAAERWRHC